MSGVITGKELVTHGRIVVREFGWRVWFRGMAAVVCRRRTTFLAIVMEVK